MTRLAPHPRLAHMMMKASDLGTRDLECGLAARLTERDLLGRVQGVPGADIRTRLDPFRGTTVRHDVDRGLRPVRGKRRYAGEAEAEAGAEAAG